MTDNEYIIHYKNAQEEWDYEISTNKNYSIHNYKEQCAENNFTINNFGFNLLVLIISKIRFNMGL